MKVNLRRIGISSLAKILAAIYAIFGLVVGACLSLYAWMTQALPQQPVSNAFRGAVFGTVSVLIFPILYAVIGFVGGLISAALYNALAGAMGGVELEWSQAQGELQGP